MFKKSCLLPALLNMIFPNPSSLQLLRKPQQTMVTIAATVLRVLGYKNNV